MGLVRVRLAPERSASPAAAFPPQSNQGQKDKDQSGRPGPRLCSSKGFRIAAVAAGEGGKRADGAQGRNQELAHGAYQFGGRFFSRDQRVSAALRPCSESSFLLSLAALALPPRRPSSTAAGLQVSACFFFSFFRFGMSRNQRYTCSSVGSQSACRYASCTTSIADKRLSAFARSHFCTSTSPLSHSGRPIMSSLIVRRPAATAHLIDFCACVRGFSFPSMTPA